MIGKIRPLQHFRDKLQPDDYDDDEDFRHCFHTLSKLTTLLPQINPPDSNPDFFVYLLVE